MRTQGAIVAIRHGQQQRVVDRLPGGIRPMTGPHDLDFLVFHNGPRLLDSVALLARSRLSAATQPIGWRQTPGGFPRYALLRWSFETNRTVRCQEVCPSAV